MGTLAAAVLALALVAPASAAASHRAAPRITSATASPSSLAASGGDVHLSVVVHHAVKCSFSADETLSGLPSTSRCRSGKASLNVVVPPNAGTALTYFFIFVTAKGAHGKTVKQRVVVVEHAPPATAPAITTQPSDLTVDAGQAATFTAGASGTPTPSVQWQESTDGGSTWADATGAGATAPTFTFVTNSSNNGIELRAVFTNTAGSATTNAVTLTVAVAPVIVQQPGSGETLPSGHSFILFAEGSGTPNPSVEWQESTDAGGTWANVGAGSASVVSGITYASYSGNASALGSDTEYRAVFTNAAGSATSNAEVLTVNPATSENWAGYVATGATFTSVVGHWTVPTVNCSGDATSVASEWVGIDGWTGDDVVEQDGTETDCNAGTAKYYAWYELFGDSGNPSVNNGGQVPLPVGDSVEPGDVITGSVTISDAEWEFDLTDLRGASRAWFYVSPEVPDYSPAPPQSYAEWVVECTSGCHSPLANFGSVTFTGSNATAAGTSSPISAFPFTAVGIYNASNDLLAAPGQLVSSGDGFAVTYSG